MKKYPFTYDSLNGFIIERIRDELIEARFIEKLIYSEVTTDPFGNVDTFERVTYRSLDFTLFSSFPHIELKDSQRSTKEFINKLLEVCNFSLAISPVSVNLLDWVESLKTGLGYSICVDSLQISSLLLEEGVSAKVLLKGNKDVREAATHLALHKKIDLDKLQFKVLMDHKSIPIQLSNTGAATVPVDFFDEFLPILRSSLRSI
jgi:hypothetical protein